VFDGHGGDAVANAAAAQLHGHLAASVDFVRDLRGALAGAFAAMDAALMAGADAAHVAGAGVEGHHVGATALVAVLRGTTLTVGTLGDCRAVLVRRDGTAVALTREHTPVSEEPRIIAAGGWLRSESNDNTADLRHIHRLPPALQRRVSSKPTYNSRTYRICGLLAVARALGDAVYKGGRWRRQAHWDWPHSHAAREFTDDLVLSTPDVVEVPITADDHFVVLACDGLWDVMTTDEVAVCMSQYLRDGHTPSAATGMVVQHALDMGSTDNITAITVLLHGASASTT
jgi:serine/threonine protein phosphatase PrpC